MKRTKTDRAKSSVSRLSITSRMMLYLMAFVAIVIALLWLFQIVWLDDFYRFYKTRQLESTMETLAASAGDDGFSDRAEAIARETDTCILLLDENRQTVASAEGMRSCVIHRMSSAEAGWLCAQAEQQGGTFTCLLRNGFRRQLIQFADPGGFARPGTASPNPASTQSPEGFVPGMTDRFEPGEEQSQSQICVRQVPLQGGTGYLMLNTIITPITATVQTLRSQLALITALVLIMALLLGLIVSRQLSRPIIETSAAAHGLSRAQYQRPKHSGSYREIAELNDTLEKAAEDLGVVENLQHELIANISHDLRTPLTMIGGYAEAMRDIPGEATAENMQIIIDEASRLSSLVSELLDFSRMQAGSAPLRTARFCLTDTISAIVSRVGQMVMNDGYTVTFEPDFSCEVDADASRISQVVYNLIGNALTYTGADKRVLVSQKAAGGNVRVSVTDTGKGIPEDEIPLIWNRYYRTKETHKRAIIGSGLGLNIVQAILEQHHAPYGVDSEPGKGSTFWFELPLSKNVSA